MTREHPRYRDHFAAAVQFLEMEQAHFRRMRELADRLRDAESAAEVTSVARALDHQAREFDSANGFLTILATLVRSEPRIDAPRKGGASGKGVAKSTAAEAVDIAIGRGCRSHDEVINSFDNDRRLSDTLEVENVDREACQVLFDDSKRRPLDEGGIQPVTFTAIGAQLRRRLSNR